MVTGCRVLILQTLHSVGVYGISHHLYKSQFLALWPLYNIWKAIHFIWLIPVLKQLTQYFYCPQSLSLLIHTTGSLLWNVPKNLPHTPFCLNCQSLSIFLL